MRIGEIAENFILKDQNGHDFELYKNLGKPLLLAFYPKDDTPVCSAQLTDYSSKIDDFIKTGLNVVGISTDSVESHFNFCEKLKLSFPILSDIDKKVSKQFEVLNFLGMSKRILVLVGTDKRILWRDSTLSFTYIKPSEILQKISGLNMKEMT